jgi:integrase/recombinase XerD
MPPRTLVATVYVRHAAACTTNEPYWKRCKCPKWLYINCDGQRSQRSAKTRSWERAEEERRKLEREFEAKQDGRENTVHSGKETNVSLTNVSLETAVDRFLASKRKQNLADSTVSKLNAIFKRQLLDWTKREDISLVAEIQVCDLENFRETWVDGPLARKKKQERLIGFFYYCQRLGWIQSNPAVLLGRIKVEEKPTDYFPKPEFDQIIDATYVYNPKAWNTEPRNQATRVRTLILLMRWSGLAIGDAVGLERSRLNSKNELMLYRAKTGHPVYVPLPQHVSEALRNIPPGPRSNPRYFFWSGNGKLRSSVGDWQRSMRRVFELADIRLDDRTPKRCHPHMFRDTFAVECLLAGVPLEQVSMLLGHKSIKITEKHYAPWVKARQEQLTTNVQKSWTNLPQVGKRTARAHTLQ